jgi:hypothetical protein
MKKLSTFQVWEGPQANMYKELLAKEGIACLVKNDRLTAAIGEIPFVECFPELWVIDDDVYPRARLLLNNWMALEADSDAAPWTCSYCGEESFPQFAACWNCSRSRD